MKINILGLIFWMSILAAGGGIDCDSMSQFWISAVVLVISGGLLMYETNKKDIKPVSDNDHSYPSFLR